MPSTYLPLREGGHLLGYRAQTPGLGAQNTALCLELIIWRQFSRRSSKGHGSGPCGTKESSGRKADVYVARHRPASSKANGACSPQGGDGVRKLTYCKQDEVLLVVLADTVIDPGTVVVHFPNAPLADAERAARQTLRGVPTEAGGPRGLRTHAPPHSSQVALGHHTVFRCVCAGRAWKAGTRPLRSQSFQTGGRAEAPRPLLLFHREKRWN